MSIKNHVSKIMVMFVLCGAILVQPAQAYAWGHGGWGGGWHGGWGWGGGGWPVLGVTVLGAAATAVWIANHQYYYYDGAYYDNTPQGYVEVTPPAVNVNQGYVVTPQYDETRNQVSGDILSVNVPNVRSGYTTVVIKRSGNGYVGPQGEFYTEFPKVSQLQLMYGK
jgi:hypothetical protein